MPASGPTSPGPATDTLETEQDHLRDARAALARMRAHTAGLTAVGGDRVSTEHLKQVLHRRMLSLADDPDVPLFFGRLDYAVGLGAEHDETLYVGRRHVTGEAVASPWSSTGGPGWRCPSTAPVRPTPCTSGGGVGSASPTAA